MPAYEVTFFSGCNQKMRKEENIKMVRVILEKISLRSRTKWKTIFFIDFICSFNGRAAAIFKVSQKRSTLDFEMQFFFHKTKKPSKWWKTRIVTESRVAYNGKIVTGIKHARWSPWVSFFGGRFFDLPNFMWFALCPDSLKIIIIVCSTWANFSQLRHWL